MNEGYREDKSIIEQDHGTGSTETIIKGLGD